MIYYEDLIAEENAPITSFPERLEKNLKEIIKFIDFKWDTERFKCLLNDNEGKFHRMKRCIDNSSLDLTSSRLNFDNRNATMDIYQKKHIIWIQSSITKVQQAMKERSIDSTYLSRYISKHVKIVFCY